MIINRVVLKIGGSILFGTFPPDSAFFSKAIRAVSNFIRRVKECNKNTKIAIVIGGGKPARHYIQLANSMGLSSYIQDLIGIEITRTNAMILLNCVKKFLEENNDSELSEKISSTIPRSSIEAIKLLEASDIIFLGGYFPGQSTIGPAALTAEAMKADLLLIATNVPGVFTSDPNIDPNAKKLARMTPQELKRLIMDYESKPGTYQVMDLVAVSVIERSGIPTIIFDARDVDNIVKVIDLYIQQKMDEIGKIGTIIY